jgi:hypothetical protein
VYVSTWNNLKDELSSHVSEGSFVFTSLHIEEEMKSDHYALEVDHMLSSLKSMGYKLLVDVSPRTLKALSFDSFEDLVIRYNLDILRADFGFTLEELVKLSQSVSICVNASMSEDGLQTLIQHSKHPIYAMHNFYPRPETGLDLDQLKEKNIPFKALEVPIFAFIPSDMMKRGPLHEGLPTCEQHRYASPLSSIIQLKMNGIDGIVVGDGICSSLATQMCNTYLREEIVSVPIKVDANYNYLINQTMTIRSDSPSKVCRLLESRLYATQGQEIIPNQCIERVKGSITIDNEKYLRYSGEIQILKQDFKADERVNVIGYVSDMDILEVLSPGMKVKFIKGE